MGSLQEELSRIENLLIPSIKTELDKYMPESDRYLELTKQLIGYKREQMRLRRDIAIYDNLKFIQDELGENKR